MVVVVVVGEWVGLGGWGLEGGGGLGAGGLVCVCVCVVGGARLGGPDGEDLAFGTRGAAADQGPISVPCMAYLGDWLDAP